MIAENDGAYIHQVDTVAKEMLRMRTKGEGNLRWVEFVLLNQEVFNDFADAAGSMLEPAVSPASAQQKRKAEDETLGSPKAKLKI